MYKVVLVFVSISVLLTFVQASAAQRFGHSSVVLPNGDMVVFGGHNFGGIDYTGRSYTGLKNDIMVFNFANRSWTPINVDSTSPKPAPRMHHTAFLSTNETGSMMIITGGTSFLRFSGERSTIFRSCGMSDVWEFDFNTSMWTQLTENTAQCAPGFRISGNFVLLVVLVGVILLTL